MDGALRPRTTSMAEFAHRPAVSFSRWPIWAGFEIAPVTAWPKSEAGAIAAVLADILRAVSKAVDVWASVKTLPACRFFSCCLCVAALNADVTAGVPMSCCGAMLPPGVDAPVFAERIGFSPAARRSWTSRWCAVLDMRSWKSRLSCACLALATLAFLPPRREARPPIAAGTQAAIFRNGRLDRVRRREAWAERSALRNTHRIGIVARPERR